jgi:hypothetical protein
MPEPGAPPDAYVRVASVADLEELAAMNQRAFISSPLQTYFSGADTASAFAHGTSNPAILTGVIASDHRSEGCKEEG